MRRLFCFGLGYSARFLARRLGTAGWTVAGTVRDAAAAAALAADGYDMHLFSRTEQGAAIGEALAGSSHVLLSVPPDEAGDPVLDLCGGALAGPHLQWVGYLSTTGVYGDRGGAWVDEKTEPNPTTERGRRRFSAEEAWRRLAARTGLPLRIFRLAGIYGPERSALDLVRSGRAVAVRLPGHAFSRIHVADLAAVLEASMIRPDRGPVFNVCDDEPAAQSDVIAHAAELLGVAAPRLWEFADAPLSDAARSFYAENKRVGNQRMKAELGVRLLYPTYREGLAAILTEDRAPPR